MYTIEQFIAAINSKVSEMTNGERPNVLETAQDAVDLVVYQQDDLFNDLNRREQREMIEAGMPEINVEFILLNYDSDEAVDDQFGEYILTDYFRL